MPAAEAVDFRDLVAYQPGAIVSRTLANKKGGTVTLFAFDAGQGLNEHTTPYDAHVLIVEGEASLTIGGAPMTAREGDIVRLPANVPHALDARVPFKMLLIMIRG